MSRKMFYALKDLNKRHDISYNPKDFWFVYSLYDSSCVFSYDSNILQ